MVCAASNMSPFSGVQSQGIVDRRLLLVPFLKRVEPGETKDFDSLFPSKEIQNLVHLSTHISPKTIKGFLLMANQHPELREIALEHYEESDEQSAMLQHYVNDRITYQKGGFVPYGSRKKVEGTLINDFERWVKRQPFDFAWDSKKKKIALSLTLVSYIKLNHPDWVDVRDGRERIGGTFGVNPKGIKHIALNKGNSTNSSNKIVSRKTLDWNQFRDELWWVEGTSSEMDLNSEEVPSELTLNKRS